MMYLVDDATDYRFLVQQVFKMFLAQYPLRLFADGLELIQYVEQPAADSAEPAVPKPSLPGLVLLDVDMPKLNGFQTLERLKQHAVWQAVPVVMMSNRVEPDFEATAYQLGATSYLTKPMDLTGIRDVMERLCHQWLDAPANV